MIASILLITALVSLLVSLRNDTERTRKALLLSYRSITTLVPSLLGMAGLIGLLLTLIPAEMIAKLFASQGAGNFVLIALLGAVVAMPAPVAFPFAGSLLKLGATLPSLAVFITTLTMVGIVTAPLEIEHFGARFTIVRQGLSFILALVIGALMGAAI